MPANKLAVAIGNQQLDLPCIRDCGTDWAKSTALKALKIVAARTSHRAGRCCPIHTDDLLGGIFKRSSFPQARRAWLSRKPDSSCTPGHGKEGYR